MGVIIVLVIFLVFLWILAYSHTERESTTVCHSKSYAPVYKPFANTQKQSATANKQEGHSISRKAINGFVYTAMMERDQYKEWCAQYLRDSGFTSVSLLSRKEGKGGHLLAYKNGLKYIILCKNSIGDNADASAVKSIYAAMPMHGCQKAVVMCNNGFSSTAINYAKELGVLLWGKNELQDLAPNNEYKKSLDFPSQQEWDRCFAERRKALGLPPYGKTRSGLYNAENFSLTEGSHTGESMKAPKISEIIVQASHGVSRHKIKVKRKKKKTQKYKQIDRHTRKEIRRLANETAKNSKLIKTKYEKIKSIYMKFALSLDRAIEIGEKQRKIIEEKQKKEWDNQEFLRDLQKGWDNYRENGHPKNILINKTYELCKKNYISAKEMEQYYDWILRANKGDLKTIAKNLQEKEDQGDIAEDERTREYAFNGGSQ